MARLRDLFSERDFLAYFVARQSSVLAFSIESAAIGWQIYLLRHRAFDLGLVGLILFAPQLLLALPAGLLADRFDRKMICVVAALGEIFALLWFVGLVMAGSKSVAAYFGVVAIIGVANACAQPANRSLLVSVVASHQYLRATALASSVAQVGGIVGPALAGALIAVRTPLAFAAAALGYAIAAGALLFLPRLRAEHHESGGSLWHSAIEGVRYIFSRRVLLGAISLDLFAVLFGGATALLPVYAVSILHVGPIGFGLMRAAPGAGAAAVAAVLARRPIERRAGPLLLWCVTGFGVATIVFGISRSLVLSVVALALTGGFDMVSMVIRSVLVQLGTPDAMRGRVNAIELIFIGASNELGAFESGTVAAFLGAEVSVVLGGIATLVVIAVWTVIFPGLRRYDRLAAPREERAVM